MRMQNIRGSVDRCADAGPLATIVEDEELQDGKTKGIHIYFFIELKRKQRIDMAFYINRLLYIPEILPSAKLGRKLVWISNKSTIGTYLTYMIFMNFVTLFVKLTLGYLYFLKAVSTIKPIF